jgi:hypothetical protein
MVVVIYLCHHFKHKSYLDINPQDFANNYPLQCALGHPSQFVYPEAFLVVLRFTN